MLVDTGCKGQADQILKALRTYNIRPGQIKLILHTHIHPDHCGSTVTLANELQAPTLIHRFEYESLKSGIVRGLIAHNWEGILAKPVVLQWGINSFKPDYQMQADVLSLADFGLNATAYLTPGHTAGSISIVDHQTNEAIVGDVVMGGYLFNWIRKSKPRFHFFIQDRQMIRWSMKRLLKLGLSSWYPGHGSGLAVSDVKSTFVDFLT